MDLTDTTSIVQFLEKTEANLRIWSEQKKEINDRIRELRMQRDAIEQERANAVLGVKHILLNMRRPQTAI